MTSQVSQAGSHDPSRLMRISEVADHLALSPSRVYELVNAGVLTSVKIGKSRRVSLGALRSFVERLEVGGDVPLPDDDGRINSAPDLGLAPLP